MFSEEEIREWELLPLNVRVLTSQQMGAWLYYRDRNRDKRVNAELLNKVAEKFISWDSKVKGTREDGRCFFTIENILKVIAEMKSEIEE